MAFRLIIAALVLVCHFVSAQQVSPDYTKPVATYSIVAWDSVTGDLGVAVQSRFLAVGAVVPYAKAGVGAVATQAYANTAYGPQGLSMLEGGLTVQQVVENLTRTDSGAAWRQIGMVDSRGNAFAYTGSSCQPYANHIIGNGYTVQGNILTGEGVLKVMARTFEITPGDLAERLLSALEAGERSGGDRRGRQSAALLVVRERGGYGGFNDRFVDLRVDDDSMPLAELRRIYRLWESTFLFDARMRSIDEFNHQRRFTAAREEMQRAIQSFNEDLRKRPDDPELMNDIAWALATHDIDLDRAITLAKRAAVLAPGKPHILSTLAECHYRLGHFDEAVAIGAELITKDPSNDEYWKQLQKFKEAKQRGAR
jgi:uncharacterized Ntn-hydrolase superfamily protein